MKIIGREQFLIKGGSTVPVEIKFIQKEKKILQKSKVQVSN